MNTTTVGVARATLVGSAETRVHFVGTLRLVAAAVREGLHESRHYDARRAAGLSHAEAAALAFADRDPG